MNKSYVRYTIGVVLTIEALLLFIPIITAVYYGEKEGFSYLYVSLICLILGLILSYKKPTNTMFFLKEGCLATVLSWLLLSFFGGLPFFFTGEMNHSFIDSMFESVSGFTTTGATILSEVESLSHCTLIWRSLSHWIGGMGVLVFLLAILPLSTGSNINLMKAESTGPSIGKLVPKIRTTAMILYVIYIILTLLQTVLLLFGNLSLFESLNIAFSTTGTGGFGIKNDSLAGYSDYVQWVTTIFMFLAAMNFTFYFYIAIKGPKKAFSIEEVRAYLAIFLSAVLLVFFDLLLHIENGAFAIKDAAFTTASIMSTTGFSISDFNLWPGFSQCILLLLTFIGGCSSSTAGGLKVSRILILIKSFRQEVLAYLHPKAVKKARMNGGILENEVIRATGAFFIVYMLIFSVSVLIISIGESDMVTNITSVAATLNNVGPGLSMVGPMGNFGFHTIPSKIVLIFDMLAGRLELFPIVVLFSRRW